MAVDSKKRKPLAISLIVYGVLLIIPFIFVFVKSSYSFRYCKGWYVYSIVGVAFGFFLLPISGFIYLGKLYFRKKSTGARGGKSKGIKAQGTAFKKAKLAMQIIVGIALLVLSILLWANMGIVGWYWNNTLPSQKGTITLKGVTGDVTIVKDADQVIHIKASSEKDVAFGQGFAHARERLFQMDFQGRLANGTLSSVLGGDKWLQVDKFFKTLGFNTYSNQSYTKIGANYTSVLDAYSAGVNAYIASSAYSRPFEFVDGKYNAEAWTPVTSLNILKLFSWSHSANFEKQLLRWELLINRKLTPERINTILPLEGDDTLTILSARDLNIPKETLEANLDYEMNSLAAEIDTIKALQQSILAGKNTSFTPIADTQNIEDFYRNVIPGYSYFPSMLTSSTWGLNKEATVNYKPLIATDMYTKLTAPSTTILMHLEVDGTMNVMGGSFPGIPGITVGATTNSTWGFSAMNADTQDLYVMTEDSTASTYTYKNSQRSYSKRVETIAYLDSSNELKYTNITVRSTVYGPVISDALSWGGLAGSTPLSLQWTGLASDDTSFEGFWDLQKASKWDSMVESAAKIKVPTLSFIFGDVTESPNMGYYGAGKIPIRQFGHTGLFPTSGDGSFDWSGYADNSKLKSKVIQKTHLVAAGNRVVPQGFQYVITMDWQHDLRARQMINNLTKTIETQGYAFQGQSIIGVQNDVNSTLFWPLYSMLLNIEPDDLDTKRELLEWNGFENSYSHTAVIFQSWVQQLYTMLKTETGIASFNEPKFLINVMQNSLSGVDDAACSSTANTTCKEFATKSMNNLAGRFKSSSAYDGSAYVQHNIFGSTWFDCLCARNISTLGGSADTILQYNFVQQSDNSFIASKGPSYRQIVDFNFDNQRQFFFMTTMGNSGNPLEGLSFDGYGPNWGSGGYLRMLFSGYSAEYTQTLRSSG